MPLKNFGSILNFAAELEAADSDFYKAAAANPASAQHKAVLEELAAEKKKNEKLMLRAMSGKRVRDDFGAHSGLHQGTFS